MQTFRKKKVSASAQIALDVKKVFFFHHLINSHIYYCCEKYHFLRARK